MVVGASLRGFERGWMIIAFLMKEGVIEGFFCRLWWHWEEEGCLTVLAGSVLSAVAGFLWFEQLVRSVYV